MSAPYGLMAELASPEALLEAARRARAAGYERVEAYSPFPVEGLAEAVGFAGSRIPLVTLLCGIAGGAGGWLLQWYPAVIGYPINTGGRPLDSWPLFVPVAFETTVLGAALAAVVAMLVANGLPRLRHPVFNVPDFDLASRNRFFLCLPDAGAGFDAERARAFLARLEPIAVLEVPS
jgi:hypothetical protein